VLFAKTCNRVRKSTVLALYLNAIHDFKLSMEIVKTGSVDQDDATRSFISGEIVKMMPRKLTTKEIESRRNLTGVFIDSTPD